MNDISKEAAELFPQGKQVVVKGEEFTIKPFGFGKFPKVLELFKRLKDTPVAAGTGGTVKEIIDIIADNGEVVVEFAMLATGKKRDFFDDVTLDQAVELVQAIIEVNADFFVKRLQPKLLEAMSKLTASLGGALSQDLSQPATGSETLSITR